MTEFRTSEWVSLGHPDKTADYIGCYILDRMLEQDEDTRCGLEVQFKENVVNLAGEITTEAKLNFEEWTKNALREIGYTKKYEEFWGEENVPCAEKVKVNSFISVQSNDIARGVDKMGWGDQGIYIGMATPDEETQNLPKDYWIAKTIGQHLYRIAKCNLKDGLGLDIKTQVTMDGVGRVRNLVVAIPCINKIAYEYARDTVEYLCDIMGIAPDIIINGTGSYIMHSSMGDAGVLGRKLVVDAYGGNCPIGGGSYWGKDGTKSDLTLNIHARNIALDWARKKDKTCYAYLSGVIGKDVVNITVKSGDRVLTSRVENIAPYELIEKYGLYRPKFVERLKKGIFCELE